MEQTFPILAVVAGVVLIPLVPAFLLYWMLPSEASLSGPLQGLNLSLTGAFAGYFALVLVVGVPVYRIWNPFGLAYELFTLSGTVILEAGLEEPVDSRKIRIFLVPRSDSVAGPIGQNQFRWSMTLPVARKPDGGITWPYDDLLIEYPDLLTEQVDIRSGVVQNEERKVSFDPVTLRRPPADLPAPRTVELGNGT